MIHNFHYDAIPKLEELENLKILRLNFNAQKRPKSQLKSILRMAFLLVAPNGLFLIMLRTLMAHIMYVIHANSIRTIELWMINADFRRVSTFNMQELVHK